MPRQAAARRKRIFGTFIAFGSACLITTALCPSAIGAAAPAASTPANPGIKALSYADLADLTLRSQVAAGVTVTKAERLKGELAPGLAPDRARFLVQATTGMLLRGTDGLSGSVNYIVDVPLDAKGKAPKLKNTRFIVLADRVPGRPLELRLTSPYSHLDWTQSNESRLRALLTEANSPSAPPIVTGIGSAFYVPGAIPGESESQVFLTTADNRPISLSILRRPGEQPTWSVALGEMVDDSAHEPAPETLLWYRLACFLPQRLPGRTIAALAAPDAAAVQKDYAFVIARLGPCTRTIVR